MGDIYYTGKAEPVAQQSTGSVDSYSGSSTYKIKIGGAAVAITAAGNQSQTISDLVDAANASTHPNFTPITFSNPTGNDIQALADIKDFPFTPELTVEGGSGTVTDFSTDTAATGPHHWSDVDNWSLGRLPGNGDDIYLLLPGARLCWDLDRSGDSPSEVWSSLTVAGDVRIGLSFSGVATSADGDTFDASSPEYRDNYLKAAITNVYVLPDPAAGLVTGSGRLHIHNTATAASITEINATAQAAADTTRPAACLLFDDADADLYVRGGRGGVGIAKGVAGETATVGEIVVDDPNNTSKVFIGDGVTFTSFTQKSGETELDAAATMPTVEVSGGRCTVQGTQAVTTMNAKGGTIISNTTGTITTLTQDIGSVVDFQQSARARTVTTYNFNRGERRIDDYLTITNDNRSGRITESIAA